MPGWRCMAFADATSLLRRQFLCLCHIVLPSRIGENLALIAFDIVIGLAIASEGKRLSIAEQSWEN